MFERQDDDAATRMNDLWQVAHHPGSRGDNDNDYDDGVYGDPAARVLLPRMLEKPRNDNGYRE